MLPIISLLSFYNDQFPPKIVKSTPHSIFNRSDSSQRDRNIAIHNDHGMEVLLMQSEGWIDDLSLSMALECTK